jgi:hypothetical protein
MCFGVDQMDLWCPKHLVEFLQNLGLYCNHLKIFILFVVGGV